MDTASAVVRHLTEPGVPKYLARLCVVLNMDDQQPMQADQADHGSSDMSLLFAASDLYTYGSEPETEKPEAEDQGGTVLELVR